MTSKSENADIRELQTEMINVNKTLEEVKSDVKTLLDRFDQYTNLQTEIDNLKEAQKTQESRHLAEITELKKRRTFVSYVVPVLASVLTAVLTFLVISYFTSMGKVNQPTTSSSSQSTQR